MVRPELRFSPSPRRLRWYRGQSGFEIGAEEFGLDARTTNSEEFAGPPLNYTSPHRHLRGSTNKMASQVTISSGRSSPEHWLTSGLTNPRIHYNKVELPNRFGSTVPLSPNTRSSGGHFTAPNYSDSLSRGSALGSSVKVDGSGRPQLERSTSELSNTATLVNDWEKSHRLVNLAGRPSAEAKRLANFPNITGNVSTTRMEMDSSMRLDSSGCFDSGSGSMSQSVHKVLVPIDRPGKRRDATLPQRQDNVWEVQRVIKPEFAQTSKAHFGTYGRDASPQRVARGKVDKYRSDCELNDGVEHSKCGARKDTTYGSRHVGYISPVRNTRIVPGMGVTKSSVCLQAVTRSDLIKEAMAKSQQLKA